MIYNVTYYFIVINRFLDPKRTRDWCRRFYRTWGASRGFNLHCPEEKACRGG